jgi:hypothetical protein
MLSRAGVGPVRPVAAREAYRWNYVRRRPVPPSAPGVEAPGGFILSTGHAKAGSVQAAGISAPAADCPENRLISAHIFINQSEYWSIVGSLGKQRADALGRRADVFR